MRPSLARERSVVRSRTALPFHDEDACHGRGVRDVGVADLATCGVDVLWPRSLGRDLTTTAVLERATVAPTGPQDAALQTGLFGPDQMFSFQWQVALHGEALTVTGRTLADWQKRRSGGIAQRITLHPFVMLPPPSRRNSWSSSSASSTASSDPGTCGTEASSSGGSS